MTRLSGPVLALYLLNPDIILRRSLFLSPTPLYIRPISPFFALFRFKSLTMSAAARVARPFASRALAQKLPLSSVRRVSPAMGFPRGTIRTFSQSPFCKNRTQIAYTKPLAFVAVCSKSYTNYSFSKI